MKARDVVLGSEYWTTVAGRSVKVRALYPVTVRGFAGQPDRHGFAVARVDNGRELPKMRTGASLRPLVEREPTEQEKAKRTKARQAATRRRLMAVCRYRDFAAQFHAAVSFREVVREAREYRARCAAVGAECSDASFRRWLRAVLQAHLQNRATWIAVTDAVSDTVALERARTFDRRGFGCSVAAARIAPMLDADPGVIQGLMTHLSSHVVFAKVGGK